MEQSPFKVRSREKRASVVGVKHQPVAPGIKLNSNVVRVLNDKRYARKSLNAQAKLAAALMALSCK